MTLRFVQLLCLLLAAFSMRLDASVCALDTAADRGLQRGLEKLLEQQGLANAVEQGELALSLLVLNDPDHPRLAQVNGNRMMYAASLPKIAILLGAAVDLEQGRLRMNAALQQDINDMIRYSCNDCSNRVLEQVGREHLLDILQSPRFGLYDPSIGGGLWMGKDYGPAPAYQRDPLAGLSHGATTYQVARFYCGLQRGELVSGESMQLMRDALSRPGIRHKFVKGLSDIDDLRLYRKSGTWRNFHADSALVESHDGAYVMVALARSPQGSAWLEKLARAMHRLALAPSTSMGPAPAVLAASR